MLKRLKKLILIGVISVTTLLSNTVIFASDNTAEVETQQTETVESETPETEPLQTEQTETTPPETDPTQSETSPETDASQPTSPDQTETPDATELPSETETSSETETPPESSGETETSSETQESESQSESQSETETEKKEEEQKKAEEEGIKNSPYATNEELLAHQNIVSVPAHVKTFGYTKVDNAAMCILRPGIKIHEEKSKSSRTVGETEEKCYAYILADSEEDWVYIESGSARGFVNAKDILSGKAAEYIINRDGGYPFAMQTLSNIENKAVSYTTTTAMDVLVEKHYAVAQKDTGIFDSTEKDATEIGKLSSNGLAYILSDCGDYYFVESGSVRGFLKKNTVSVGADIDSQISAVTEVNYATAQEEVSADHNKAYYYTLTTVQDPKEAYREAIVNFALQFVGNPYVWGGTSLTNGADCSGFVQSVYSNFGYGIPRVACDQAEYGTQINISDAEPGDLIFYAKSGYVYHVSMYIGNGQVVQAYSSNAGIIKSDIGPNAVWATKVFR